MFWPAGTPNEIKVPPLKIDKRLIGTQDEPAHDSTRDQKIIYLEMSRLGYAMVVLTWNAIYLYQPKVSFDVIQINLIAWF